MEIGPQQPPPDPRLRHERRAEDKWPARLVVEAAKLRDQLLIAVHLVTSPGKRRPALIGYLEEGKATHRRRITIAELDPKDTIRIAFWGASTKTLVFGMIPVPDEDPLAGG